MLILCQYFFGMKKIKSLFENVVSDESLSAFKNEANARFDFLKDKTNLAWSASVASMTEISDFLANTDYVKSLNEYTSKLSKAMDEGFAIGSFDAETGLSMAPNNHRILDGGHSFWESIEKAQQIGEQEGWSGLDTFHEWFKSYFTDLSSSAGMPIFGENSDNIYLLLRDMGISEEVARDFVTVNGQEAFESILGGALGGVSLFMAWKKEDKESFSRTLGALGLISLVGMNPVLLMLVVVSAGVAYNKLVCRKSLEKGAVLSGVGMVVGVLAPDPFIVPVICSVVIVSYLNKKMGDDFDVRLFVSDSFRFVASPENQKKVIQGFSNLQSLLRQQLVKSAG